MKNLFIKIKNAIKSPPIFFLCLTKLGLFNWLSDETFLKIKYRIEFKKKLDLNNPISFNEKLQWLKLNDRKDIYTTMVDKYEAKRYVSKLIGEEYIIPTLGIYDKFEDINFDELPDQFVIKSTHDSGGTVICKNKSQLDIKKAKKKINKSLKKNYYYQCREWPYKNVKRRIIVEEYIKDDKIDDLIDYKFLCFNGKPEMLYMTVKNDNIWENYYDLNFNPINFVHNMPRYVSEFEKPKNFDKMIEIVKILSNGIPFVRIDLHNIDGRILFGECTFYEWGGFMPYKNQEDDIKLGKLIDIEKLKQPKI